MKAAPAPPYVEQFRSEVYGTVFGRRMDAVHRLHAGDRLILVPDPEGTDNPAVWVHAPGGDVVGHLPFTVSRWLASWMLDGGRCSAMVDRVGADDIESWRRVIIVVRLS
ncbi:MAG TPA: HIRAN domain-containing protein [Gemmatimonadaceae bacterium]|nr:HIRAN domain-containing protein [Gemmatimonadaceae bacterium]